MANKNCCVLRTANPTNVKRPSYCDPTSLPLIDQEAKGGGTKKKNYKWAANFLGTRGPKKITRQKIHEKIHKKVSRRDETHNQKHRPHRG